MSEPKTKPTRASVDRFIARVEDPQRREDCKLIAGLMLAATGEKAVMWGDSIVGFGRYHYKYASGREGDWPVTGFSPRKRELTVYIMPGFDRYADLLAKLGKHRKSVSCLYLKRLADIDVGVLKKLIEASVKAMESQRIRD